MSEKSVLQSSAGSPPAMMKKKSLRPKLWKSICLYACHLMANTMHKYAIDNARSAYLARWDEVMVPDVENLVDWIKLFMGISTRNIFAILGSTAFFGMALFCFVVYAWLYFEANAQGDKYQAHMLAFSAAAGFSVAMSLGFGVWIGTFVVTPRAVILGLLISDLAHLVMPKLRRRDDVCARVEVVVADKA